MRCSRTIIAAAHTTNNPDMSQNTGRVRLVASGGRFGIELDDDGRFIVADQVGGQPLALGHSVSGIPDTPGICIARNETTSAEVALHIDHRGVTPRSDGPVTKAD
jgi:hypothetical protein